VLEMLGTFNEDLSKLTARSAAMTRGAVRALHPHRAIRRGIVEIGQDSAHPTSAPHAQLGRRRTETLASFSKSKDDSVYEPSLRGAKRRSNPFFLYARDGLLYAARWIASLRSQ